jgi:cellulose biosynthesis protein BcsQ
MKTARENGAEFLVLDIAPNADQTASLAARSADLVLIPCRASTFDLEAIETTLLLAKAAGKPAYVVLNAIPPRSGIGKEAAEGLTSRGAKVAPARLLSELPSPTASSMVEQRRNSNRRGRPLRKSGCYTSGYVVLWACRYVGMPERRHEDNA